MQKINLQSTSATQPEENNTNKTIDQTNPQTYSNNHQTAIDDTQELSQNLNSNHSGVVRPVTLNNTNSSMKKSTKRKFIIVSVLALIAGTLTGFGAHKLQQPSADKEPIQQIAGDTVRAGDVFGMQDSDLFPDSAQGYLEAGGINGEGSHRLLRMGGPSQTVYLTSTVTDLDRIVGMEVKVWGETYKGQKAGWLMDVGKVEVIDVNGQAPLEEEI